MPSPKAKKKPSDRQAKTTRYGSSWKTPLNDLELPSGEICQVRRPGVQGLIKAGVLHSLDSLTTIVQTETIPKAEGKVIAQDKSIEEIVKDPEKFGAMMSTVDKIVCFVVMQPKVVSDMTPVLDDEGLPKTNADGDPELRELSDEEKAEAVAEYQAEHPERDIVFVDWIDTMDKMFIMNFAVGGSADLAEFRSATEASLGSISAGEAAAPTTE